MNVAADGVNPISSNDLASPCNMKGDVGCCIVCRDTCHKGHDVVEQDINIASYCDCALTSGCCGILLPADREDDSWKAKRMVDQIIAQTGKGIYSDREFPPAAQSLLGIGGAGK